MIPAWRIKLLICGYYSFAGILIGPCTINYTQAIALVQFFFLSLFHNQLSHAVRAHHTILLRVHATRKPSLIVYTGI